MDLSVKRTPMPTPSGRTSAPEIPQDLSVKPCAAEANADEVPAAVREAASTMIEALHNLPAFSPLAYPFILPMGLGMDLRARPAPDDFLLKELAAAHAVALPKAHEKRDVKTPEAKSLPASSVPTHAKAQAAGKKPDAHHSRPSPAHRASPYPSLREDSLKSRKSVERGPHEASAQQTVQAKTADLVVPKHTALIVPNPKNRTQGDQKQRVPLTPGQAVTNSKPQMQQIKSLLFQQGVSSCKTPLSNSKVLPQNPVVKANGQEKPVGPATKSSSTEVSNNRGSRCSVEIQAQSYLPRDSCFLSPSLPASSSPVPATQSQSLKRNRRKQMCPRKRIKQEDYTPDDEDEQEESEGDLHCMPEALNDPLNNELLRNKSPKDRTTAAIQNGDHTPQMDTSYDEQEAGLDTPEGTGDMDDAELEGSASSPSSSSTASGQSPMKGPANDNRKKKGSSHISAATTKNREKRKRQRLHGQAYTTPHGKLYPQRKVQDKDCSKCRYNCSSNITLEQRQQIFDHFWGLDSYLKRLYYYCQSIKEKPAKTMKHTRECSREYTFKLDNGERVRVCKGFYLATLDVSDKAVRIAMEKRKRGKCIVDKRSFNPLNKSKVEEKDRARSHIESHLIADIYAKTTEGENSCSDTLPGQELNTTDLYREYRKECLDEGKEPIPEEVYIKVFNTEYDLTSVQV